MTGSWIVTNPNGDTYETPNRGEAEDALTDGGTLTWENDDD
jgi:hypothetical protein